MAWKLVHCWKSEGRDIGWAESIALKLAILLLVDHGFKDCLITIQGDNTGMTGTFNKGRSQSIPHNDSMMYHSIGNPEQHLNFSVYVASAVNRANLFSHGILGCCYE